jgi:protein crumbs
MCTCLEQFSGLNCESAINCTDYCFNNGTCSFNSNKPYCSCVSEYTGTRCENRILAREFCKSKKCQNGGQCEEYEKNAKCICKQGFTGEYCELALKCDNSKVTCFNNATCVLDDNQNELCKF